jgi:hypothetical protein
MKYSKPEVVLVAAAIDAVQSSEKGEPFVIEVAPMRALTHNAYEADE